MKGILMSFFYTVLVLLSLIAHGSARATEANAFHIDTLPSKKPQLLLSAAEFTKATVRTQKGKTILQLTLNDEGATKLHQYSVNHVGQKLAVVLHDEVKATPVIRVPLEGHAFEVDALEASDANQIVALLHP
jgi:preprotein translocase subunit SecD